MDHLGKAQRIIAVALEDARREGYLQALADVERAMYSGWDALVQLVQAKAPSGEGSSHGREESPPNQGSSTSGL